MGRVGRGQSVWWERESGQQCGVWWRDIGQSVSGGGQCVWGQVSESSQWETQAICSEGHTCTVDTHNV